MRISNSFSFMKHEKKSLRGCFLRARRDTFCREPARALLSAAQSQCSRRGHHTHRARPPAPRSLLRRPPVIFPPMAVPRRDFFAQSEPAAPTQIDENEHDGPHVSSESQVVITTDTCPIDSRALGVGWVAGFGFPCYGPALRVGRTKKNREVALVRSPRPACCALCSPALGESDTYPAVSGGGGGAENRNAPNDTAALSSVENSEAARYVFVVIVIGDVMIGGRRYHTFVLA